MAMRRFFRGTGFVVMWLIILLVAWGIVWFMLELVNKVSTNGL